VFVISIDGALKTGALIGVDYSDHLKYDAPVIDGTHVRSMSAQASSHVRIVQLSSAQIYTFSQ